MRLHQKKVQDVLIIISLILLALALRLILFNIKTNDLTEFVIPWYDTLIKAGRLNALKTNFYNYPPAYIYFLDIMTLFPWISNLVAIKLVSVAFDFLAAIAVYKLLGAVTTNTTFKWLGFFSTIFLPTIFVESSLWGQVDIIYTTFLLWSLFYIFKDKPILAMLSFSIAFCFKLQAAFFLPVFVILFLQRKIKFYLFFLIPITYFVSILPCWILGRPLTDLLMIYLHQIDIYNSLTMNAPNLYVFINSGNNVNFWITIAYLLTAIVIIGYILLRWLKWKGMSQKTICFDAAFFTILIPFFLPKMHERYFFTGGVFLLIIALLYHQEIIALILMQVSSLLSYIRYFSGWSDNWVKVASVINLFVLFFFFFEAKDLLTNLNKPKSDLSIQ